MPLENGTELGTKDIYYKLFCPPPKKILFKKKKQISSRSSRLGQITKLARLTLSRDLEKD